MKINRADLLRVIQTVAPVVKNRTTIPIMSMIKIEALNGGFHATASDFDRYVKASCCCEGDLTGCCLNPGPLLAVCGYGPEVVRIEQDGGRLSIHSQSSSKLSTLSADEYPKWPAEKVVELVVNPSDLCQAIKAVAWAAANKPDRGIDKQTIWIGMDTKAHVLESGCMDGRRLGHFSMSAVVPNAKMFLLAEQAPLLCSVLSGTEPHISLGESWITAHCNDLACAIKQASEIKFPVDFMLKAMQGAALVGSLPREATMQAMESMQSLNGIEPYCHGSATFKAKEVSFDYVGKINEFHSVVPLTPRASPLPKSQRAGSTPNVAGVVAENGLKAAQNPAPIQFDAALLHNVLKNTPGESLVCRYDDTALFFEGDNTTSMLALMHLR